jgi:hypothetical protein
MVSSVALAKEDSLVNSSELRMAGQSSGTENEGCRADLSRRSETKAEARSAEAGWFDNGQADYGSASQISV